MELLSLNLRKRMVNLFLATKPKKLDFNYDFKRDIVRDSISINDGIFSFKTKPFLDKDSFEKVKSKYVEHKDIQVIDMD